MSEPRQFQKFLCHAESYQARWVGQSLRLTIRVKGGGPFNGHTVGVVIPAGEVEQFATKGRRRDEDKIANVPPEKNLGEPEETILLRSEMCDHESPWAADFDCWYIWGWVGTEDSGTCAILVIPYDVFVKAWSNHVQPATV